MYEAEVARGAALLDRLRPGWAGEIETDRLAMESCHRCVLGQLYGDYFAAWPVVLGPLEWKPYSMSAHGFTLRSEEQNYIADDEAVVLARFAELADAWRAEVRRRVASHVLSLRPARKFSWSRWRMRDV